MNPIYKNVALWFVIALMMFMLYSLFNQTPPPTKSISYSEFLAMVDEGQISNVIIQGQEILVTDSKSNHFKIYAPEIKLVLDRLVARNIAITTKPPPEQPWVIQILANWFPIIILIGLWIFFMRQMQSGGGKALSFGKSRARMLSDQSNKVTFDDVAGVDEAKEELSEIVEFLKDPKKFTRLGGRIPKGVLLMGPPGTGKTLLGRAIAGEAGVPFFSISGSDFVEMFVGVGASRVRDLFVQGKKHAPCIIFVDEIDAVGRHRGAGLGGGHDEREQTLNQLLVEMDGFESNEGVILLSATNRPDVLDPALMRPGRFDRQVVVSLPDLRGREQILKVHMKKIPIGADMNTLVIAKGTPGFSGADLENLVNEAALIAAKRNKDSVDMEDFDEAKDKVYMGLERKSKVLREEDKRLTAYHEGGHALVARFLPNTDAVNKITIIPRGRALGVTWLLPDEHDHLFKDQLESKIAIDFGGRVAEELVYGRITTGASQDIKNATLIAQKMIRSWGMGLDLAPISYTRDDEQIFIGRELAQPREYSEETARKIDLEVSNVVRKAYQRARQVLEQNIDILHRLTELLLEKETIMGDELDKLIYSMRPGFVLPSDKEKAKLAEAQAPKPAPPPLPAAEASSDQEG